MAKKKRKDANESIDWYLISIDRLKQIALVVFLLLLGFGIWWYIQHERGNPRTNAESAITEARQAVKTQAGTKELEQHRGDFHREQKKLEQASSDSAAGKYPDEHR